MLKSSISRAIKLVSRGSIGPFSIGKRKCFAPSLPKTCAATSGKSAMSPNIISADPEKPLKCCIT